MDQVAALFQNNTFLAIGVGIPWIVSIVDLVRSYIIHHLFQWLCFAVSGIFIFLILQNINQAIEYAWITNVIGTILSALLLWGLAGIIAYKVFK